MRGVFRLSVKSQRFLRPWIGIVVAYAVAVQSLLIAVGGFSPPANVGDDAPAFEFCLHDAQDAPELPAGNPDHTGSTHCIFCFAGSHHAAFGAAPVALQARHLDALRRPAGKSMTRYALSARMDPEDLREVISTYQKCVTLHCKPASALPRGSLSSAI